MLFQFLGVYLGVEIQTHPNMNIKRNIIFALESRKKNGCTNKLKQSASEINTDLLKYYAEMQNVFKEFEVQETIITI